MKLHRRGLFAGLAGLLAGSKAVAALPAATVLLEDDPYDFTPTLDWDRAPYVYTSTVCPDRLTFTPSPVLKPGDAITGGGVVYRVA